MALQFAQNQPLGTKEAGLFRQLIKLYESKQSKKGLKIADQILKKHPNHGETLAMKGLLTANLGPDKKEEAYDLVRQGIKSDLKSHVCWHAYGLLYRADHDYKEAIKCYMNGLRQDKENMMILRDLALLQIQTRDLQGFVDTRQRILDLKPSNRNHWISFALAHHANKSYEVAVQVLDAYRKTLSDEIPASEAYEHSELILYKAMVLEEGGRLDDALQVLESEKDAIRDHRGRMEMRASILMKAGRLQEAEQQFRELLQANPDHYRYHEGLQAAMGLRPKVSGAENQAVAAVIAATALTDEQRARLTALYSELVATYPRSSSCKRIQLDFLQGDAFAAAADAYVRKYLLKGVPSLFMDLRPLYRDTSKANLLESLFNGYLQHLSSHKTLPPLQPQASSSSAATQETAPSQEALQQAHVWVLCYLAQHYEHTGRTTQGLDLIDQAIKQASDLIELYTTRARLLKHAGDYDGAAHSAETARRLDLGDRYVNSIAVKALFRAGKPDAASKTAALFTKDGHQMSMLHDLQHMWFECKAGASYLKRKEWGKALKQLTAVTSHFKEIEEDQFDFHFYCIRKTTMRAYVETLRMEDRLYGHPFYSKAAQGAITAYLALHDTPSSAEADANEEAAMAGMSSEERKKYKLKKKKEEKQKSKTEEDARTAAASKDQQGAKPGEKGKKGGDKKEADPDPDGVKLASTPQPLEEAAKLVASLKEHAAGVLQTQLLALQVYLRKGKMLLALSAAQRAADIAGPQHPEVHLAIIRFCSKAQANTAAGAPAPHPEVASLLKSGQARLLGKHNGNVKAYNDEWLAAHCQGSNQGSGAIEARLGGAAALLVLAGEGQMQQQDAKMQASKILSSASPLSGSEHQHEHCMAVTQMLEADVGDAAAAKKWREACAQAFPFSRFFGGSRQLKLEPDYGFEDMVEAFGYLSFQ